MKIYQLYLNLHVDILRGKISAKILLIFKEIGFEFRWKLPWHTCIDKSSNSILSETKQSTQKFYSTFFIHSRM